MRKSALFCGPAKIPGGDPEYRAGPDGSVSTGFQCGKAFRGSPGVIHERGISLILNGAMTDCLIAKAKRAVTPGD